MKLRGQYLYHQFCIKQFNVIPAYYICVLCGSEKNIDFPYTAVTVWFL